MRLERLVDEVGIGVDEARPRRHEDRAAGAVIKNAIDDVARGAATLLEGLAAVSQRRNGRRATLESIASAP